MPGCPCESECQAGRQALRCNRLRNVAAAAGAANPGPRRSGRQRDFAEPLPCYGHRHKAFRITRTVQTHLPNVYTKLGITFRAQLAQEAARHADP